MKYCNPNLFALKNIQYIFIHFLYAESDENGEVEVLKDRKGNAYA